MSCREIRHPHRRDTREGATACHKGRRSPHLHLLHTLVSGVDTPSSKSEDTHPVSWAQSWLCPAGSGETGGRVSVPRPPDVSSESASAKYGFRSTDRGPVFRPGCGGRENTGNAPTHLQKRVHPRRQSQDQGLEAGGDRNVHSGSPARPRVETGSVGVASRRPVSRGTTGAAGVWQGTGSGVRSPRQAVARAGTEVSRLHKAMAGLGVTWLGLPGAWNRGGRWLKPPAHGAG